jgi:hypothetical protein
MNVLLYAVVDEASPPANGQGLGQRPLRGVTHENLRAVISDHDGSPRADEPSLLAYGHIVDQLMGGGAVLPARFGTTAPTDGEIQEMLFERRAELSKGLDRVRGAVEFAVRERVSGVPPAEESTQDDADNPGTAYLRRRLGQEQQARELSRRVAVAAGELIRASIHRPHKAVAYLVEQVHADEFVRRTRALGLTVTGPWPPYSFARSSQ